MQYLPPICSLPPKIGEYAYYDLRISKSLRKKRENSLGIWIINIQNSEKKLACSYSSKERIENQPFITNHGVIDILHKNKCDIL